MAMEKLVRFLRLVSPKGTKKNWTPEEKWRVRLSMIYAGSSWFAVACIAYIHFTNKKKESSPKDPEILKDIADVDDDELLVEQHDVYLATYTRTQASLPLSTGISQFFDLGLKKRENTSPEK